jgi:aspartyl-tRNA(Asn)/glutamyl-tRNA(Gln) amidotransferase subunit A
VILGKTNTPEHGWKADTDNLAFGATRNPWNPDRSPGGSSGGTSAALASGMVPLATGSDGGGSIRIPAALCGHSALKPSPGRVPNGGTRAPGSGLLGIKAPMTLRVRDQAYALDTVVGPDPLDPFSFQATEPWYPSVAGPSLGVPRRVVWAPTMGYDVDHEVLAVVEGAVRALEAAGTEVVVVDEVFDGDPVMTFLTLWSICWLRDQATTRVAARRADRPGLTAQMRYARDHLASARTPGADERSAAQIAAVLEQAPLLRRPPSPGRLLRRWPLRARSTGRSRSRGCASPTRSTSPATRRVGQRRLHCRRHACGSAGRGPPPRRSRGAPRWAASRPPISPSSPG